MCTLANGTNMRLSSVLGRHIAVGDEIAFPVPAGAEISGELSITTLAVSRGQPDHPPRAVHQLELE